MIRIDFSEPDVQRIKQLRYEHPHPRIRKRMDVLWLKSQGLTHQEICRLTGICSNTLRSYLRLFRSGGVDNVMELKFYAPTSELEQHRHRLEVHFRQHPLGMAPRKVGSIPSKADPQAQETFRVKELEPRLEEAKRGRRAIFLSMPPTSSSAPFLVFSGHSPASSSRLPPGEDGSTFSAR
jgi:hypothetical protein